MMSNNGFVEKEKYDELKKKYSKLCLKHDRMLKKYQKYDKYRQVIFTGTGENEKPILYFKRVSHGSTPLRGIVYIISSRIRKNHCDICGKRRKTTAHHIIPRRLNSVNRELAQLRIRICDECNHGMHPESVDENGVIEKQNKLIKSLKDRLNQAAINIIDPLWELMDIREKHARYDIYNAQNLVNKKRKLHPFHRYCQGRLKEIEYVKNTVRDIVNRAFGTKV